MEPKILLADEPTGSLDERNAEAVMRLLTSLTRHLECTLLVVTHSEKVASHMDGSIRLQGGNFMLWPVVKALLGHYRRHPLQILLVWLGLTLGVSLLVGVTAINHHAKQAYASGEKTFSLIPFHIAFALSTQKPKFRKASISNCAAKGSNKCVPFDIQKVTTADGLELNLVGVDPISLLQLRNVVTIGDIASQDMIKVPTTIIVSHDLAELKGWQNGDTLTLNNGIQLGPIKIDSKKGIRGTRILADMSLVRAMKKSSGLSVIACGEMSASKLENLRKMIPNGMTLSRSSQSELESLTKALPLPICLR